AVPAKVGREHPEASRQPFLRQSAEPPAMRRDAVQADERRSVTVSPFVHVEPHQPPSASACTNRGRVSRQSPAIATSAVPVTGAAERLKTTITAAFTEAAACSKSPSVSTAT